MADITIIRNGARISLANFPKLGSGSENIAVAVSASGAYDTYTTELYYGWYQGSSMQKMLAQYQNGLYYIPSNALFNAGNVYLTLRLVSGGNKVSTNTIPITIEKSAVNNEYSILPATETWQSAVDYYINNANSLLNKRIDELAAKIIKDYVTPEMFGAIGDGSEDDTNALQSAINYAINTKDETIKVRGFKTYKITSQIEIVGNTFGKIIDLEINTIKADVTGSALILKGGIQCSRFRIDTFENTGVCISIDPNAWCTYGLFEGQYWRSENDKCINMVTSASQTNFFNDNVFRVRRYIKGQVYFEKCHQVTVEYGGFEYGNLCVNTCNTFTLYNGHFVDPGNSYSIKTIGYCPAFTIISGVGGKIGNDLATEEERGACVFSSGTYGHIISRIDRSLSEVSDRNSFTISAGRILGTHQSGSVTVSSGVYDTRNVAGVKCPTTFITTNETTEIILDKAIYGKNNIINGINQIIIQLNNTTLKISEGYQNSETKEIKTYEGGYYETVILIFTGEKWIDFSLSKGKQTIETNVFNGVYDTREITNGKYPTTFITTNETTEIILDKYVYGFGKSAINQIVIQTNNTTLKISEGIKYKETTEIKTYTKTNYAKVMLLFTGRKWISILLTEI